MFRWDADVNHSPKLENGPNVDLSWMSNTFLVVEYTSFHALTEGYFWLVQFSLEIGYISLIPVKKL